MCCFLLPYYYIFDNELVKVVTTTSCRGLAKPSSGLKFVEATENNPNDDKYEEQSDDSTFNGSDSEGSEETQDDS
ncbi:hypothetical protein SUGI_0362690 [Cryptomeria japonica]|nr:hypothetical protein SUGI_0362690 [Cryptomeria japonica]